MRYSKQREIIFHAIVSSKLHPTADMVYGALKGEHPTLSLATVYRNLNFLSERELITRIPVPDGGDRFDGNGDPHYHMICTNCGKIFDIRLPSINSVEQDVERNTGFHVTSHSLILYGVCIDCLESV